MTDSASAGKPRLFYSEGSPYARICRMALREGGLSQAVDETVTTLILGWLGAWLVTGHFLRQTRPTET